MIKKIGENLPLKIISLLLASILWYCVKYLGK